MKAVIVDLLGGHAAALRDDGRVVKLPDAGYTLGQVIEIRERARSHWRRGFISLAAAAALLLGIGGAAYAIPYGTVTLDADSSIQYTINLFDYVLDVQAEDEEGEALLAELDLRQVRHRRVDSAITSTVEQIERRGFFDNPDASIFVSAHTRSDKHTDRLHRELETVVNRAAPPSALEGTDHTAVPDTERMPVEPGTAPGPDTAGVQTPGENPFDGDHCQDTRDREGEISTIPQDLPDPGENAELLPANAPADPRGDQSPDSSEPVSSDRRPSDRSEGVDPAAESGEVHPVPQGEPDMQPAGNPAEPGFGDFAQPGGNQPGANHGWSRR